MSKSFHPLTSEGFVWRNAQEAGEKLRRFKEAGAQLLHFVWDWDDTVVFGQGSTWHVMRDALPPQLKAEHKKLYLHYKGLQDQGQLTGPLEREWSARALTLHVVNRTTLSSISREAKKVRVREGATLAFRVCEEAEVPTVVLSAGVKDVIDAVAIEHHIHPTTVVATELAKERRRVVGWHPDTMVDATTKREMGHPELSLLRDLRPNAVLYGDQPHDARMFDNEGLRIRVDGVHTIGTVAWEAYLAESWDANYDGIIIRDDLMAAASLNHWLIGSGGLIVPEQSAIPIQPTYDQSTMRA